MRPARTAVFTFTFLLSRTSVSFWFRLFNSAFRLILVFIFASPLSLSLVLEVVEKARPDGGLHFHVLAVANQRLVLVQAVHVGVQVDLGFHFRFSFVPKDTKLNAHFMPKSETRSTVARFFGKCLCCKANRCRRSFEKR